jgi:hypothetical protein
MAGSTRYTKLAIFSQDFDPTCFKIILRYLRECKLAGPDDVLEQPTITATIKPYYQRLVQYLMLDHLVITTQEKFSSTLRTKNMRVNDSGLAVTHVGSSSRAEDVVGSASYTHGRVEIQLHIDELPPVNGQFVMVGMMNRQDVKKLFVGGEKSHQEFNSFYGWVYQDLGSGQRVCYRSLGPKGMSPSREVASWKTGDTLTMVVDFEQGHDTRISLTMTGGMQHTPITGVPKAIELCLRIRLKHPGTRVSLLSN